MHINPYLAFNGNCREAFEFYERALGAEPVMMMTYDKMPGGHKGPPEIAGKVMHARLMLGDTPLMGSDAPPDRYRAPGGYMINISVDDPGKADRLFAAHAEGGIVTMPIGETFWALRFGMVTDRFGVPWMVNCEKKDAGRT
jgi:PhnB protein